jgi:LacI family transcriptional regulator
MAPTTMKRIAEDLGVSVTTVSKVLNNRADIGEATRARVLARVAELGYQPNAVARSLSLRRTHTLGVVIPDLMHSFFVEVIGGLEAVVHSHGYGLLLCNSGEDPRKERSSLQLLAQRQVDGIVLASASASANSDLLHRLTARGVCLVMIDRDDHPDIACDRVITDDEEVGYLATSHLLAVGRRAVAHVAGPPIVHAGRRTAGYRRALAEAGVRVREDWIARGGFKEADGYRAMTRLLSARKRPNGVFAVNDPAAIGAIKAVWDAGLRVPEDVAVAGAGDIAHGDMLRVPLTTVTWPRNELGRRAAELLLERLDSKTGCPHKRVVVPPRLVVRDSSGARPETEACVSA